MSKIRNVDVTFGIENIQTLKFSYEDIPEIHALQKETVQFNVGMITNFDVENKKLAIDTLVDLLDTQTNITFCEIKTRIIFHIINFEDVFKAESGKITFSNDIMANFFVIAISTTRGNLFAKTEGSPIREIFLPIINPRDFLAKRSSNE